MASKRNPLNWRYVGDTTRHVLESFSYQYTVRKGGWPVTITGRLTGHMNRVKKWHVWGIPMVNTLKIKKPEAVQNLLPHIQTIGSILHLSVSFIISFRYLSPPVLTIYLCCLYRYAIYLFRYFPPQESRSVGVPPFLGPFTHHLSMTPVIRS